jgi:hypothetical protein
VFDVRFRDEEWRKAICQGHEIGGHSVRHRRLAKKSQSSQRAEKRVKKDNSVAPARLRLRNRDYFSTEMATKAEQRRLTSNPLDKAPTLFINLYFGCAVQDVAMPLGLGTLISRRLLVPRHVSPI